MRIQLRRLGVMAAIVAGATACADNLEVQNLNNPDFNRVYANPVGVEGVVSTLYRTFHNGVQAGEGLNAQSKVYALESYGQVANFGMALRVGIPRSFIDNTRGNAVLTGNFNNWSSMSRLVRNSATVAQNVRAYITSGRTAGSAARDQRNLAFTYFINGIAMATLAMGYDSVAIATPATPQTAIPVLIAPRAALDTAMLMLDSAATIIGAVSGNDAQIPADWMGGTALTPTEFVRLIRSYQARFLAGIARTPAERAAVDWARVRDLAAAGITADHRITLSGTTNWTSALDAGTFQSNVGWHQVSLLIIGMADNSGAYVAMMQRPLNQRFGDSVLVITPDQRWPQGATRAAQITNTALPLRAGAYIQNRPANEDRADLSNPWGTSMYDHRRWRAVVDANGNGPYTFMSATEISMLRAEALIRLNTDLTTAMNLVNASRTANGLPAFTDPAGVAPGGAACSPRPVLANGTSDCASLLEAMKYEKRMETMLTGYMQWFLDSRGWGDLPANTPLHWPVPYQEMDARNLPFYNMPSTGTIPAAAAPSTYGL